jgi:site-specific DNA-methyltransferase (adenine-specific)
MEVVMSEVDYKVVSPLEIKVKDGLPRLRKEMGKIKDLAESFAKFGQLQPCVVNRDMELIAGGRRLAACIEAGISVKIVFADTVDPLTMREMELEENIQRKALTAAEEILAVSELHDLKRQIHGETRQGVVGGWKLDDTAEIIGKTRASVIGDLALAEVLKDFPVLATCKTKSDIKRAVKGLQRISDSVAALETYDEDMKGKADKFEIHNADCVDFMKQMKDKSVNILFTDPPYGINIHDVTIGLGGHTGSAVTMSGFQYEDGFEESMTLINEVAKESFRVVKDNGFAVVFCAISHFWIIRSMFEAAGWNCSQRPIIWIKNESGQNNAPSKWMSAGYESMLFARKIHAKLVIEGKVDWIQCPNVTPSVRIHQAEKPVALIKELLSRLAMPGAVVLDPFAGSCATVEAAIELKMYPIAIEKLVKAYATGKQRIVNYYKSKGE